MNTSLSNDLDYLPNIRKLRKFKSKKATELGIIDWDFPDESIVGFIYILRNRLNGKYYIGKHSHSNSCGGTHCKYVTSGTRIKKAIAKYGLENFSRDILVYCGSEEELEKEEIALIDLDDPFCYNLSSGGLGRKLGSKTSTKTRQLLSEQRKGEGNANFGKVTSEETRNKISESLKKRYSEGFKNPSTGGCLEGCTCKRHSPETREKISKAMRKRIVSEETRSKMSAASAGKKKTAEHKRKVSEGLKRYNARKRGATNEEV